MTLRAVINHRKRLVQGIMAVGMGIFLLSMVAGQLFALPEAVTLPFGLCGFGAAFLTMAGTYLIGLRCPDCRGRLTAFFLQYGGLRMDPNVRFCPLCGIGLDSEYTGGRSS
jgi:hypothetical protein